MATRQIAIHRIDKRKTDRATQYELRQLIEAIFAAKHYDLKTWYHDTHIVFHITLPHDHQPIGLRK